jgi:hypothetical protein
MPVIEQPQSVSTLIDLLKSVDAVLTWIVRESGLQSETLQPLFEAVLEDIQARIAEAIRRLESITHEDDRLYRDLQYYGLTGASLEMKAALGRELGDSVVASATEAVEPSSAPKILGISLAPFLKWVNLLLGSLSKALPVLEAVKEYKEGVELTVEHQRSAPAPDRSIFPGLRGN